MLTRVHNLLFHSLPLPLETETSKKKNATTYEMRKAPCQLKIIIVGGGIAGLSSAFCLGSAGHNVTVVDSARIPAEVGAGIQISPNMSRLLIRWGLQGRLDEMGVKPLSASFCRYDTDERVGFALIGDKMEKDYNAPYYHLHRGDLIAMLYDIAKPLMTVRRDKVVAISSRPFPSITFESGEAMAADMIIGADGVKSIARSIIIDGPDRPVPTGDAVYRALLPANELMKDPDLRSLIEKPEIHLWMGPHRHIVGYCIRGTELYNFVMAHPDTVSEESWSTPANVKEIPVVFKGWNPRIMKLIALIKTAMKSRLMLRAPLTRWVDQSERIALLGDSCHPMLPYMAQGAAMALEDAAVLGNLFSRISNRSQIGPLLKAYESLRIPRATATQMASHGNGAIFHLPDGVEQKARDVSMQAAMKDVLKEQSGEFRGNISHAGNRNYLADEERNDTQFGYDADEVADAWWEGTGSKIFEYHMSWTAKL